MPIETRKRADCPAQPLALNAGDPQCMTENGRRLDAGHAADAARDVVDALADGLENHKRGAPHDVVGAALDDDAAVRQVYNPIAALSLVHVVRGDEDGEAFAGHVVDEVPELAARLGVNARGGL